MEYILVTGGLGYIGSHVVAELLIQDYNVIILDNCSNSDESILDQIGFHKEHQLLFYKADIRKGKDLANIFSRHIIKTVIHLAGPCGSEAGQVNPLYYFSNNVSGTITLLGAMKHFGCRHLIYGSSAVIYGNALSPVCEQDLVGRGPMSSYARSILMTEQILQEQVSADSSYCINVLRLFNVCGSVYRLPSNVNELIYQLKKGDKIVIYGSEHATPDGTCIRDYIHVSDVAAAFMAALRLRRGFNIYNIGSGAGISDLQLLEYFTKISGSATIDWNFEEVRPNDVPMLYACIGKAFNELGWLPRKNINDIFASVSF